MSTNDKNFFQSSAADTAIMGGAFGTATQDASQPITSTKTAEVLRNVFVRSTDRSPKDVLSWRSALIAAESIYWPNQTRLYDLYADLLLDPFLSGVIRKRISQVVNKNLMFVTDGGEEVPEVGKVIRTKVFKDVMRQILWTKMWGVTGMEFVPGKTLAYNLIPRKHIKRKTQKITYEQWDLDNGISYTDLTNVWVLGDPGDLGLLLMCGYVALLKKGSVSDWAQYIEIFGSPAIVVKYDGYDEQAKKQAERIMHSVGNSMRMTVSKEMEVEFMDGKQSNGDGKLHDAFRNACNQEMSVIILGNTETTGHTSTGTGAKSKTHSDQQLEIIKDDMDDICDALNSEHFRNILKSYNIPVDGGSFVFDKEIDINTISDKITVDIQLLNAGLPIPTSYWYKTYGIPEPKSGEPVLTPPKPAEPQSAQEVPPPAVPMAEKPAAPPKPQKPQTKPVEASASSPNTPGVSPAPQPGITMADLQNALSDFFGLAPKP